MPDRTSTAHARPGEPADIARLSAKEALQRLELLADISRVLDTTTDDYEQAVQRVAEICVSAFADFCAIEMVSPAGQLKTMAYRAQEGNGVQASRNWVPIGLPYAKSGALLAFDGNDPSEAIGETRRELGAESLVLAPIAEGGITVGYFVAGTGPHRRAFRPSALRIGVEVASRLAAALKRSTLHREMQAASKEQARAVRRLRRLATAAAKLAGAATPQEVLRVACMEARAIQEADGAMARWWMPDGSIVEARSGQVDDEMAEHAFLATDGRRVALDTGWVGYPLLPNQVGRQAALVVFTGRELSSDEELVFESLASLVPVAFERAVGTGAALAQEARFRAVVSTSPVALVGLRDGAEVALANPAAQRLFDWEGRAGAVVLPAAVRAEFWELAELVRITGHVANRVVSAEPFELSLSAAPMPRVSNGGDDVTVLVAATDLSEVKRAERALVQAQRLEAMGLVAGRVAHDFNNLLTVIIGYTELLRRQPEAAAHARAVTNISRAARRAASLTQQLLGLAGAQRDGATAVDLADELRELRTVLDRLAGESVTTSFDLPDEPAMVALTAAGAEQLVLNLALNACHAMQTKGGSLAIKLVVVTVGSDAATPPTPLEPPKGPSGWAVLTVSDDGPGMTEEVRARCLEPFFTTKGRGQGTGLGLPTVHALVGEGGGHLEIESVVGQGTSVAVWLPVSEGLPLASEATPDEAWPAGKVLSGRALFVEDQDELKDLGARALEEAGLEVTTAGDGEAALLVARTQGPFDVLVTDIMLPGRSGLEVASALHAGGADLPVLFVTAYSKAAGPLPAEGPHTQVLHKPYRLEELVFTVAVLLEAKGLGGEA